MPRPKLEKLIERRETLRDRVADSGEMLPGSLVHRTRRCGKLSCKCAKPGAAGHPDWILTRRVKGKTVTRSVPASAVAAVQRQIGAYHQFQDWVRQWLEANAELCQARWAKVLETSENEVKKGGSKRRSRKKSSTN